MPTQVNINCFYVGTDNRVLIAGLQRPDNSYVNNATLVATLYDRLNNPISQAVALPCLYQPGSNGDYLCIIPASAALADRMVYCLEVTVVDVPGGVPSQSQQTLLRITRPAHFIDL